MVKNTPRVRKPRAPLFVLVDSGRREYLDALASAGYRVASVSSVKEALAFRPRPHGVIVELVIPDADFSQLSMARSPGRRTRAMTVVALASEDRQEAVVKAGAVFCRHPCPPEELLEIVKRIAVLPEP